MVRESTVAMRGAFVESTWSAPHTHINVGALSYAACGKMPHRSVEGVIVCSTRPAADEEGAHNS